MIFRVHVYSAVAGSEGYAYFGARKEALEYREKLVREGYRADDVTIESQPTPKTQQELIGLLLRWADHPDNG